MFWLYFPELRYVLVNWEVYNRENDAGAPQLRPLVLDPRVQQHHHQSEQRLRPEGLPIQDGIDALLQSEEIKADLFNFEHDLWNF
jgi:hypothetical protein